jgi:hypothetical protein
MRVLPATIRRACSVLRWYTVGVIVIVLLWPAELLIMLAQAYLNMRGGKRCQLSIAVSTRSSSYRLGELDEAASR